jgi:hypothetical protein
MHIHGSSMNFNQMGLSGAAGAERAAAAQKAAELRGKLAAAATASAASDPQETLMIGQWNEAQNAGANPLSVAGRSPDFRE